MADADAVVVATDGDNSNIVIGQIAQKHFGVGCVVVRVLDPARAEFFAQQGLRTVCPTSTAIDVLTDAVMTCERRAGRRSSRCTRSSRAAARSAPTSRAR